VLDRTQKVRGRVDSRSSKPHHYWVVWEEPIAEREEVPQTRWTARGAPFKLLV
jgi:hypothetical protein